MESILTSIKKLLGPGEAYDHFDPDIIMHINSAFSVLKQLGVPHSKRLRIEDDSTIWSDLFPDDELMDMVVDYVYLKVKLVFDPPTSSAVLESMKEQIKEYEWRLNAGAESKES